MQLAMASELAALICSRGLKAKKKIIWVPEHNIPKTWSVGG